MDNDTTEAYSIHLSEGDFRRERVMLGPDAFALYESDGSEYTPSDLIRRETWWHVMSCADDVALMTSAHEGSLIDDMHELDSAWLRAIYIKRMTGPFMHDASLLAHEEFEAVIFNALHGYYRQAIGCLRNAFEVLTHASAYAIAQDTSGFAAWLAGNEEPAVGVSLRTLHDSATGQQLRHASGYSVFGVSRTDNAWARVQYARLCAYAHSRAGSNNVDFWQSNGPVHVPLAVARVRDELREMLAMACVLMKVGNSQFQVPPILAGLFSTPVASWKDGASLVLKTGVIA